jgi:5-methylcytosine-specific restriction endonuclease McrA
MEYTGRTRHNLRLTDKVVCTVEQRTSDSVHSILNIHSGRHRAGEHMTVCISCNVQRFSKYTLDDMRLAHSDRDLNRRQLREQ